MASQYGCLAPNHPLSLPRICPQLAIFALLLAASAIYPPPHLAACGATVSSSNLGSLHYPTLACNASAVAGAGRVPPIVGQSCTVINAYGTWVDRRVCSAGAVTFPSNEAELVATIAAAVRRSLPVKVATLTGHSIPPWTCPRGDSGLIISTQNLNRNIIVDQSSLQVTADSGVQLRELIDTLARAELALPNSPYFDAITLGGLLSTGSHGSSLYSKGCAVHDYVVSMRLVVPASAEKGYAEVLHLAQGHEFFNAAKVSLGLLGVISQVTLAVEPQFKRSMEQQVEWDGGLEAMVEGFGQAYEFGDLSWLPSMRTVVLSKEQRVPAGTRGESVNAYRPFIPTHLLLSYGLRTLDELGERFLAWKCASAALLSAILLQHGPGLNSILKSRPIKVGYQHQMQTSGGCSISTHPKWACPWLRPGLKGYFYHETSFTLPMENVSHFIVDVKRLREVTGQTSLCGLDFYAGILMRYVKWSSAYLGHQADGVSFDITYYRSYEAHIPRLHEDVYEEIEQIALNKYGGWPHWAKNRVLAFADVRSKYPKMDQFILAKEKLDPGGLFSSEWSDGVLGTKGHLGSDADYCALEGMCICKEDRHCAPEKGYFCRPGRVYKEARVCSARTGEDSLWKLLQSHVIVWLQLFITASITTTYDLIMYVRNVVV